MRRSKMGLFNNVGRYSDIHEYIRNFQQQTQSGLKLDSNNNYDVEGKRLANVGQGVDADDAVVMHQMASLGTGLETKLAQLKADSLQVDGSSHMTGDLDLRGQKLINPGEIEMNRKLITNLGTDENNDLSAVNMITLKKFHPNVPDHTHEVTKDIDLKELFNVVQSKQRNLNELKTHYDSLVSFEEVNENFLSRKEEFPMETQLDMNHNSITNLKDPEFGGEAATKSYADSKLSKFGGTMTGSIDMSGNKILNLNVPTANSDAATKTYADGKLAKTGGTMSGDLNLGGNKITDLGDPTAGEDAVNMKFVGTKIAENGISAISHPPNEFDYLMKNALESSSESNVTGVEIVDFAATPHKFNKKSYVMQIAKRAADNMFLGRLGFNMYKLPEGEYTICVEFFPAKIGGVSVNAVSTALNVNRQATKVFKTYSRSIIHMHKWRISPPEYLMLDLKWQGAASDSSPETAHLIIYGVKEFQPDVPSQVYDYPFSFNSREMLMHTGLNLNGHKLTAATKFFVFARFELGENRNHLMFSNEDNKTLRYSQLWGFDCNIKEVVFDKGTNFSLSLSVLGRASKSKTRHSSQIPARFTFDTPVLKTEEFYFWINGLREKYARATILIELV